MLRITKITTVALLAVSLPLTVLPASAAPLMPATSTSKTTSLPIENVQYRGGHRGGGYHHHGGGGGGVAGAVIGGLAVGALIAGAAAASQANQEAQQQAAWCAQRYRSYDPASGTYLARDGMRYSCP